MGLHAHFSSISQAQAQMRERGFQRWHGCSDFALNYPLPEKDFTGAKNLFRCILIYDSTFFTIMRMYFSGRTPLRWAGQALPRERASQALHRIPLCAPTHGGYARSNGEVRYIYKVMINLSIALKGFRIRLQKFSRLFPVSPWAHKKVLRVSS